MDKKEIKKLQDGLCTAFIDCMYNSNLAYRPEFISNDHKKGKKVLASIEQELSNCDEFCISVAFITKSGITPLLQILEELFFQQLGRGLCKFEEKEYVVVLDFIGNYMNNFMIPIALSGDLLQ